MDGNKRAALIVARFGLNNWLNGDMVRTMFVTEVNGIEREIISLGSVKQFEDGDKELKSISPARRTTTRESKKTLTHSVTGMMIGQGIPLSYTTEDRGHKPDLDERYENDGVVYAYLNAKK